MKKTIRIISVILCLSFISTLFACNKNSGNGIVYPDFPLTENNGTPSWEQGEKSDLTIDWYVDRASFYWTGAAGSAVVNKIYEKTGIKFNFITPLNGSGDMLNSILNNDNMPDLITIDVNNLTRIQMQEKGYCYSLDELSKRWAPTLFSNWDPEINQLFGATDGDLYCIPCLYYSMADLDAFGQQHSVLNAGGSFFARKSYLKWYLSAYPDANPTTPDGFIEMCKKVKEKYDLTYTIATDAFDNSVDNKAVNRLAQYFAVPRENADGTLTYLEAQEGYYDCLKFLNRCYREGLITDSNFTNTKAQNGNVLQSGSCFVFMGNPQDFGTQIREFTKKHTKGSGTESDPYVTDDEYVGIVITNERGDAPTITDLSGNGDMVTMVSKDCKRPDRVVKLIDYLTSLEGQMLTYFGVEGEHWYYEIQPGETVVEDGISKIFKYGRVQWYDEAFKKISSGQTSSIGALTFQLLRPNKAIAKLATFSGDEMYHFATYLVENMKRVVVPWTYRGKLLSVSSVRDASAGSNYLEINAKATLNQQLWRENLAKIITKSTENECREAYLATLLRAEQNGYKEVLEFDNKTFAKLKKQFGVSHVWAPLTDGYVATPVTSIYGDTSYIAPIPDFIKRV